jgi:hypothetical protein
MRRFARKRKRAEGDAPAETTTAPAPTARLHLGDSASQPPPDGAEDRTSAFPESTRPRRHAVAVGAGAGCGRLLSVDRTRPGRATAIVKASVSRAAHALHGAGISRVTMARRSDAGSGRFTPQAATAKS